MNQESQTIIKETLLGILVNMGISAEIEWEVLEDTAIFNVRTPDSGILIGQHGANLGALQYLTRVLVHKKSSGSDHFVVDVEGYKKNREEFLRELARQAVTRVRDTKQTLLLKPMMAYERRVVHAEISKHPDIITESVGEEPERRILIKPKS